MARDDEPKVEPASAGVDAGEQAKPTSEMSGKEVKERLAHEPDKELHPAGEPKKEADKTSMPVPNDADVHDPPLRTPYPQEPIVRTLATGAGAHEPPDPDKFEASGRPKYDEAKASK